MQRDAKRTRIDEQRFAHRMGGWHSVDIRSPDFRRCAGPHQKHAWWPAIRPGKAKASRRHGPRPLSARERAEHPRSLSKAIRKGLPPRFSLFASPYATSARRGSFVAPHRSPRRQRTGVSRVPRALRNACSNSQVAIFACVRSGPKTSEREMDFCCWIRITHSRIPPPPR